MQFLTNTLLFTIILAASVKTGRDNALQSAKKLFQKGNLENKIWRA